MDDVKRELESRNLSVKGLKSQLILRLTRALRSETEKDASSSPEAEDENADEDKKKKEDEKKASDRRPLPESPAVIVRPSRTAKHGKFDCAVMSLSLLLDYRQEDNKEHSFEVSLFAELFNEMMMRDFGFRIYRALVEAPEAREEDSKDKKKSEKKEEKRDRKDEKDDSHRKDDVDSDKEDDESEEDDCDGDEKKEKDRRKRPRRKRRKSSSTRDPHLLLSFCYWDQTQCGYLLDRDLEDIFHTLGLMLTRAQVRKLIGKVSRREVLRYRRLTDGPADSEKRPADKAPELDLEALASGNRRLIPACGGGATPSGGGEAVVCRGALVDVGKLVDRLEDSEKARMEADRETQACLAELERLQEEAASGEKLRRRLDAELEEQRRKLRTTEDEMRRARQEAERYQRALASVRDGLQGTLAAVEGAMARKSCRSSRKGGSSEEEPPEPAQADERPPRDTPVPKRKGGDDMDAE